eukprot:CAMPEP_0115865670 /NCGR_PEP_ID=MMETSP0287-20121206/19843_1 /TAXON_ID=412157 /ORGANISM="Chrysochromulina rotalis, Strain UIO044" /LENGTH=187 /DNA_ID=CAMNT_0003320193 /DNA_START=160 /DNA_END=723 /DNA_ORIENTATION=-
MMKTSLCFAFMMLPNAIDAAAVPAAVTVTEIENMRAELEAKDNEVNRIIEQLRTEIAQVRAKQEALINENNRMPEPQGADGAIGAPHEEGEEGADPSINEVGTQCCWSTPACQRSHHCGGRRLLEDEFRATPTPTPVILQKTSSFSVPEGDAAMVRELQAEINRLTRNLPVQKNLPNPVTKELPSGI